MKSSLPRVVFDTNVIVSALLLPASVPRRSFDKALDQGTILLSLPVFYELHAVLSRRRFDKYLLREERVQFLAALVKAAEIINITETISDCRDPKDNKFLELAVCGGASCVVSGDEDLLALNPFRGIAVVSPRTFLSDF